MIQSHFFKVCACGLLTWTTQLSATSAMPKAVSVPLRAVDPQRETESGSTVKIEVSNQITHQTGDTNKGEEILQLPSDLSAAEKIIEKMPRIGV